MKKEGFFKIAGIVAAATVGDGVFALPFIFYQSGWLLSLFYFALLGAMVVSAHILYLKTLEKVGEKERLLGLVRIYLGEGGFWIGLMVIVLGLLLTLVAYLILGAQFIRLAIPGMPPLLPLIIFWIFISLPVFLSDRHVVDLELVGIACSSSVILLIFLTAWPNVTFSGIAAVNTQNLFLPFGAILFSLAGWTSIEPAYESRKKFGRDKGDGAWKALALGTVSAIALYAMFVAGILGSAAQIAPDTVSGLAGWPGWKKEILTVLGLLTVATVYLPISREIKNALEHDLGWSKFASRSLILFAPLALIGLGFNNFLTVVGLVGGAFLSMQYLLIVFVGRHALSLSPVRKFFLDLIAAIFILAAVYEVYVFIVR